ncbi:1,4-dihydroxy-2-naphthoate polyprenyltransferase, partial [Vibrio sp. 10N.222.51.A6]
MKQSLLIWLDAARPKTLPLALVSILTGSSLAFAGG